MADAVHSVQKGVRNMAGRVAVTSQEMERHPLRRLGPDAWQAPKRALQILQRLRVFGQG